MQVLLIYEIHIMRYVIRAMGCNLSPILQWVLWDALGVATKLDRTGIGMGIGIRVGMPTTIFKGKKRTGWVPTNPERTGMA